MEALDPIEVVGLFAEERDHLLHVLRTLSADQWAAPTACPGWCVQDVALHLLGVDIGVLSRHRDGFRDPSTFGPETPDWAALVAFLNNLNQIWVDATRRISPRLLCDLLGFTGGMVDAYYRELDVHSIGGPVIWAGTGLAPVWLDMAREYTERWVHQQQIRDALTLPGLTEPRYFAPVLAAFVHGVPRALAPIPAPPGIRIRLVIVGPAGGTWLTVRMDDVWRMAKDDNAPADAAVTLDQDDAWRLFTRGITPDEALPRVCLDGDPRLARAVLDTVSIIA